MGWEKNSIFKYYISYGIVLLLAISISANEIDNSIIIKSNIFCFTSIDNLELSKNILKKN